MGLETVEFIIKLEEHFDIVIPDRAAERITTVGELQAFVVQALEEQARATDPDQVFAEIKHVLEHDFDVPARSIVPSARIARDLGLE